MELTSGNTAVLERPEAKVEGTAKDETIIEEQSGIEEIAETGNQKNNSVSELAEVTPETAETNVSAISKGTTVEADPAFIPLAVAKIEAEIKAFTGEQKEKAVSTFVATTLTKFCNDNARFAEVLYKTTRTLSDVCREVMAGTGNAISDFEVYRRAVQAYFPNAEIQCYMSIYITGAPPTDEEIKRAPKVQAPVTPAYTPRAQNPVTAAPAKEPEYFETIHLEL